LLSTMTTTTTSAKTTAESLTQQSSSLAKMIRSPMVPHVAFWTFGLFFKFVFPKSFQWLAYDSITTLLLSVWYPLCATISLIHRDEKSRNSHDGRETESLQMERQFWIEYWSVGFATVQFFYQFLLLVPSLQQMGRYDYPRLPVVLSEMKLLFYVWIFAMDTLLVRFQQYLGEPERNENWKKFVPLTFLTQAVGPRLMRVQMAISEQISRDTWHRLIQRKAQRVLELMVVFQFLEEESMSYLLQLMDEGRSLLLLSVFAVLPSSLCQLGTLYAQLIFPGARSLAARGNAMEILSLKYWVLNSVLSLFLAGTWWLWWCIPFSTQLILGIRCFATFPSTINHHYSGVEQELITFGILKGEPKLAVRQTKTVQALRAVVKRLPRDRQASSFQFELDDNESDSETKDGDDDSSVGSVDTTESEEERRRQRRREKRAKKRLLKQQKLAGSNSSRPPPLLSESFISKYANDDENDANTQRENGFIDNDVQYSSFINSNTSCESQSDGNVIDLTNSGSNDKEQRDARNAARYPTSIPKPSTRSGSSDNEDLTVGSSYFSSQIQSGKITPIHIATPTETVVGEVEVQVRASIAQSVSDRSKRTPLFPATHPRSFGANLEMPSASYETPQTSNDANDTTDSGFGISDVDSNADEVNESFESWAPSNEESSAAKTVETSVEEEEVVSAPRRSSRLQQLREWQDQRQNEEETKETKKKKKSFKSKPRPEGPREEEKSSDKKTKKSSKKSSGIFVDKGEKKWKETSPKKSKKSKTPTKEAADTKSTEASVEKKAKKKSPKKSKKKSEAPLEPGESSRSSSASPQKTTKSKTKKVPNSKKKKAREASPGVLGGILGRK